MSCGNFPRPQAFLWPVHDVLGVGSNEMSQLRGKYSFCDALHIDTNSVMHYGDTFNI